MLLKEDIYVAKEDIDKTCPPFYNGVLEEVRTMRYDEEEELHKAQTQVVAKDNKLIQNIVRRDVKRRVYKLSLSEQKALAYIVSMIKKPIDGEAPQYTYSIDTKLFCNICGIANSDRNATHLKESLESLSADGVWIKTERNSLLYLQWITTPEVKEDHIEVTIPQKTMPYLYGLQECFTSYNLDQILYLSGKYSIALFELLKSNLYKGTFDISIEEYKNYMGLGENEYKDFKSLRKRVIDPPVDEINEKPTGLMVEWEPVRAYHGHSYAAIRFTVREKKPMEQAKAKVLEDGKKKKH